MTDRVSRIEQDWKRVRPKGPIDAVGVSTRCRLIAEHFHQAAQESLAAFDLVPFEWEVLGMLLRRGAPHEASAGVIARETGRSSASITHRLDKLEARGLVRRATDAADRRGVNVYLTDAGRSLTDAAIEARLTAAHQQLGVLSLDERQAVSAGLRKVFLDISPKG